MLAPGQHAADAAAQHPRPGPPALVQERPGRPRTPRERERRGRGLDRIAGVEVAAPETGRQRRLEPAQLVRREQRPLAGRDDRRSLTGEHEYPRGLGGEVEAVELAIVVERLAVQLSQHRVERVLDRARVASGGRPGQPAALEQLDARAGLCEERRRGAADDPAPDDRDVGEAGQSPAAA
jgi:hypothetical protein